MNNEVGKRIKELRTSLGMTQEELGEKVGVKKAAINKYEKGIVENIKREMQISLAKALNTDPASLFYPELMQTAIEKQNEGRFREKCKCLTQNEIENIFDIMDVLIKGKDK